MRKVILTMNEGKRFEVIKKLVDTNGNKKNAALKLSCSDFAKRAKMLPVTLVIKIRKL